MKRINGKIYVDASILNPPEEFQTFENIVGQLNVAKMAIEMKLTAATHLNEHEPFTEMELIGLSNTLSTVCRSLELTMKKLRDETRDDH